MKYPGKPYLTIFTLLILISSQLLAQKESITLGQVPMPFLQMESFEEDPQAEAIVIYDKGESFFEYQEQLGYVIKFTRTKRIKVFNEAGLAYGNVEVMAYQGSDGNKESLKSFKAYSHNINNLGTIEKREVGLEAVHEERINDFWSVYKVAIPNVKPGTVVEYEYVMQTPFLGNPPDWQFQSRIPTLYSEYVLNAIPFYSYTFSAQGIREFDYRNSTASKVKRQFGSVVDVYGQNMGSGVEFTDLVHTYVMKDIPAFRDEDYITSVEDYIQKLDFQLAVIYQPSGSSREIMTSWETLVNTMMDSKSIGKYLDASEKLAKKEILEMIDIDSKNDVAKAVEIIEFMKANFHWNEMYGKSTSEKPKYVLENKTGNVGELNLLLIGTLRAAGFEVDPVILSTRSNGKIKKQFPSDPSFNYLVALVKIQEKSFLADITEPLIAYNRIPLRAINDQGLVLDKSVPWVDLNVNPISENLKQFNISLYPEKGIGTSKLNLQMTEFESYSYKVQFQNDSEKLTKLLKDKGLELNDNIQSFNFEKPRLPYVIEANVDFELGRLGDKIFFQPFLNFPMKENLLTQKERNYPVDFVYPANYSFEVKVNIPEGYTLIQSIDDYNFSNELTELNLESSTLDNVITIRANYAFKKAVYEPRQYSYLKNQINQIIERFNKEMVFQKEN